MHDAIHLLHRVVADGWEEPIEDCSLRAPCRALAKRKPQERERGELVGVISPVLLAVDDPRLVGMQAQPDRAQPGGDPPTRIPDLLLAEAMDHNVIAVAFKREAGKL